VLREPTNHVLRDPSDDRLRRLSDEDLLRRTRELTSHSRHTEALLLAHLGEIDARRLYLREACSSLFAYCTERLHFSEGEAELRIAACRAARQYPLILDMLADGRLHLTAVALLAPHLTAANRETVLRRAVHRSKRDVLELVAELAPQPDVPALIRKLPSAAPPVSVPRPADVIRSESPVSPESELAAGFQLPCRPPTPRSSAAASQGSRAAKIEPLAPSRYKVQFTASTELRDKLERLRALMRPTVPDGDLARIIEEAVTEKLARLERSRFAATERPRKSLEETEVTPSSRHVPAAVRRAVHKRDECQCAFRDAQGRRCTARAWLELHHRRPYGVGGDHSVPNVALLCKAHNRFLEEIDYGTRGGGRHG